MAPPVMAPPVIAPPVIATEIQALRRGRGLRGDVAGRIGPLLHELAASGRAEESAPSGAAPAAANDAAQLRRILGGKLEALAGRLPEDLRTAILAALALHPATVDMRTYELRREWVARQVERVARTAERRIEEAQELLAQEIAGELARERSRQAHPAELESWYIESFSAVFLLDGEVPEAVERRVIVPAVNGLAELDLAIDVPVDPGLAAAAAAAADDQGRRAGTRGGTRADQDTVPDQAAAPAARRRVARVRDAHPGAARRPAARLLRVPA